jgi:Flp pilus assembly protein TadG
VHRDPVAGWSHRSRVSREGGSAIAEFVLVATVVLILSIGALQLALLLHARNVAMSSASEGARRAARADATPADGVDRATALLEDSLRPGYADSVTATVTVQDGLRVVEVTITAPLPVLGLLGPSGSMVVTGRAIMERQ